MVKSINSIELKKKLDDNENVTLIDCRELTEWNQGYIEKAKLIALSEFPEKYKGTLNDPSAEIIIQCRSGKRSMNACQFLKEQGFTNLTSLEGGIIGWQTEGYEIKKDS